MTLANGIYHSMSFQEARQAYLNGQISKDEWEDFAITWRNSAARFSSHAEEFDCCTCYDQSGKRIAPAEDCPVPQLIPNHQSIKAKEKEENDIPD